MTYEVRRSGFDRVIRHFKSIQPAQRKEINQWLGEVAADQTQYVEADYEEKVKVKNTQPNEIFIPFTKFVTGTAGTKVDPKHRERINWLEKGTRAHDIYARHAKALHFVWHGKEIFAKHVHVSGIKARHFIRDGIKLFQSQRLPHKIRELSVRLARLSRTVGWG
jgi:hypothetical protein